MHRSLPIQSMMKGYLYFKDGNPLYRMLKLNDSWTKCENYSAGGWRDVDTLLEDNNINVMIKIPEFWWIDDYIESTETHNLKYVHMPNQDGITIKKLMCLHMKVILMEIIIDLLK